MKTFKNLSVLFFVGLLLFAWSCNNDEANPDGPACLLTRITEPGGETGGTISHIIEYNGQRKPARFYDADNPMNYIAIEWQGDDLKKVTKYENNALSKIYTYERNVDTISVLVENFYKSSYFEKFVYTLDGNNHPIKEQWYWQNNDGSWEPSNYYIYTWENDNLIKSEYWLTDKVYTKTYEYDNKNNTYQSLGLFYDVEALSNNNIAKETIQYEGGSADVTTYEYLYNENAYPYKLTKTFSNNTTEEISFEYDCN